MHLDLQHQREVVVQFLIGDVHGDQLGYDISISKAFHDLSISKKRINAFLILGQAQHALADAFIRGCIWLHVLHQYVEMGLSFSSFFEFLLLHK